MFLRLKHFIFTDPNKYTESLIAIAEIKKIISPGDLKAVGAELAFMTKACERRQDSEKKKQNKKMAKVLSLSLIFIAITAGVVYAVKKNA